MNSRFSRRRFLGAALLLPLSPVLGQPPSDVARLAPIAPDGFVSAVYRRLPSDGGPHFVSLLPLGGAR